VRPIGQAIFLAWEGLILVVSLRAKTPKEGRSRGLLLASGFLLFAAPWALRNWSVWGKLTISPVDQWNLAYYSASATLADAEGIPLEQARERILASASAGTGEEITALSVIADHPISFLKVHLSGTLAVLFGYGRESLRPLLGPPVQFPRGLSGGDLSGMWMWLVQSLRDADQLRGLAVGFLSVAYIGLVYVFAVIGARRIWQASHAHRIVALVILVTLAALLFPVGAVGNARFRVPMEPFLSILAGAGLSIRPLSARFVAWPGGSRRSFG
jgi:hypothetical protein